MRLKLKDYRGEFENFLFSSIRASFNIYKPTSYNPKDFKNEDRFFDIGPCSLTRSNLKLTGGLQPPTYCPRIQLIKQIDQGRSSSILSSLSTQSGSGTRSKKPQVECNLEMQLIVKDEIKEISDIEIFLL
jgi:hypothetical protein